MNFHCFRLLLFCLSVSICSCNDEEVSTPEFHASAEAVPVTGPDVPGVESFDAAMKSLLKQWNVAGATVAIAREGRLLMARGYGYADYDAKQLMQPDATMRIASISKFITAIAILQLKDQGRLNLDAKVFDILSEYRVAPNGDARVREITVRHLLQHAGGWDRSIAGDPLLQNAINAGMFEIALRVSCVDLIQATMSMPLQFTPGTKAHYSNLGFCILGRVVERIVGVPYEIYVRDSVLAPLDIHAMSIGYERAELRGPYEPKYYTFDGDHLAQSVIAGEGLVAPPYGGLDLLAVDSAGGWIASAVDLARVMTAVDGSRGTQAISSASLAEMIADPQLDDIADPNYWFGLGVEVGPTPTTWSKNGGLPGTRSLAVHNRYGYTWVFIANTGPEGNGFQSQFVAAIQQGFVAHGPGGFVGSSTDLFAQYPSPHLPARHQ